MAKVQIRVSDGDGIDHAKLGYAKGYRGYFNWMIPAKRKSSFTCPVGGEQCRDFWYCHDTSKQGDVKLCRIHQVEEV